MLNVVNLSKDFLMHIRGGTEIVSLRNVSFTLKEGEFLGIVGQSGSGKSSLLKCIYRTYIPTSGNIWYTDKNGTKIDLAVANENTVINLRKTEIGYISQFLHIIPRLTALEIIAGVLSANGCARGSALLTAGEYLRKVGIPESLWNMFPSTFSGGEKQRLNIIHAIAGKPRLLLLDEPTASLDPVTKVIVTSLIKELKNEGTSMIGVFHDHETMKKLADVQLQLKLDVSGSTA